MHVCMNVCMYECMYVCIMNIQVSYEVKIQHAFAKKSKKTLENGQDATIQSGTRYREMVLSALDSVNIPV